MLNLTNRHLLVDNSLTFGGFHYNDPRQIYAQIHWSDGLSLDPRPYVSARRRGRQLFGLLRELRR